jgi:predicted GH43/DUF377 family glycosyl hydrolase
MKKFALVFVCPALLLCATEQSPWKANDQPALTPGIIGEWDDWAIACPTILKRGSKWWMLYEGIIFDTDGVRSAFGIAESDDKMTWRKHSQNPLFTPALSETQSCSSPCAAWWRNGFLVVYIVSEDPIQAAFSGKNPEDAPVAARLARSDDGLIWNNMATAQVPIFSKTSYGFQPSLYAEGDRLHLWWVGPGTDDQPALFHSISTDGLNWSKPNGQPAKEIDAREISGVRVYPSGDFYLLTYVASEADKSSGQRKISVVTRISRDARNWTAQGPPEFPLASLPIDGTPWMIFESDGARLFWSEQQPNNAWRLSSAFCEKKNYASH